MAIKISDLTLVETVNGTDVLPTVHESETKKVTLDQIKNYTNKDLSLLTIQKVNSVSDVTEPNIIYLVPTSDEQDNIYDEYLLIDNKPELLGPETVDLSNYPTTDQMNSAISSAIGGTLNGSY